MASNLTSQVRNIAEVTTAVAKGDLSKKITVDVRGEILELKNTINTMVDQLSSFAAEVTRVAREVGTEGKLGGQADVRGVAGTWKDLTDNVNSMASNLTSQVRNIAAVTTAVAMGDLSKKITVDVRGEILELKNTINTMVDQLSSFASEVTRVAREVGTEGKLGGQAEVKGVAGTWKDLTDNVNLMASNLTNQVRGIAKVVTAVANGNLKRKLVLEAKGEIEELAETINNMIDTLATFADQVTTVAREVGIEGKLGGQASVPGASGTWRDLTDNVNRLAANLTTQVRAIAEVATAVTKGDLSRSIAVEAAGEVAALKDNINEMIRNLRETTEKNTAQDWLKTNLAKFTRLLQGQRDLFAVSKLILSELGPLVSMQHGVFYINESPESEPDMKLLASYAYRERKNISSRFRSGEGLVGQCALEKDRILLTEVPGDYIQINSGLGEARPLNIVVLPVLFEGQVKAVIELASFQRFSDIHLTFFDQLTESIGIVINTITATMRTEELLKQSQTLANELQTRQSELTETNRRLQEQAKSLQQSEERLKQQQEELQQTNEELEEKANLLAKQNLEVERKNQEIERASRALQEKAEQLALTSKYKSEFLANMSHELRTPLNSMLILSKLLSDADDGLTDKQRDFARTIHSAGSDLLELINEILDLSKIESGMMDVEVSRVAFTELSDFVERTFRQVAHDKALDFFIHADPELPPAVYTDQKRLQQVLKNLLSNAFKFTERGNVSLRMSLANEGWTENHQTLRSASRVVAFSVSDTGIGISPDKHKVIFEAFQQADGTTSRKYGGTGLGLSISREIAALLGGEVRLVSSPGAGSTFTLFLPATFVPAARARRKPYGIVAEEPPAVEEVHADLENLVIENAVEDDRADIQPGDRTLLIVEDDLNFAKILMEMAHDRGFKVLLALRGEAGLALAREYVPSAITLDIELPGMDGWTVLDRLKHHRGTRHIPVQILSVSDERQRGLKMGAMAYDTKPITSDNLSEALSRIEAFVRRGIKSLLVIEDDPIQRSSILELIGNGDVETIAVGTAHDALAQLKNKHYECVVLDLGLPDMDGFELMRTIKSEIGDIPIIVYTGKELSHNEETELRRLAETIIVKDVRSLERLLDETALFLHRVEENLPEPKRQLLEQLHKSDPVLAGKKVLVIDDDMRNIFALTSLLERYEMRVIYSENGRDGIEMLKNATDIDVVLVDIMMPEMDGYDAMRKIREFPEFRTLPLIALTAKAMKGDREKCIEAGASDYITKPADSEQLLSLLRVWLFK
jgi:CheY-like chemotaxis protein/HAMP domain-containing protein/GAF domain-containing protein